MSTDRNPDRIVRAWLDLMPDQAPDRVVDAVLQAVETTPQARRRLVRGPRRLPNMNRLFVIAAVVVLGAAAFGGALLVGGGRIATAPTPAPAIVAEPSPAAIGFPNAILHEWVGEPRDVPGLGVSTRTKLDFDERGALLLTGTEYGYGGRMRSTFNSDGLSLTLTSTEDGDGCTAGDVGRYDYAISPGGSVLTLQPGADDCAARGVAVPGTWYRVACTDTTDGCLGELEAGTHPSQYVDPLLPIGSTWAPRFGALTYTVPDGWSNSADWPNTFSLTPTADYRLEDANGPADGSFHEILAFTQPRAAVQDGACEQVADASVDTSVDGLLAWLRRQPPIALTPAQPITIDGHPGQVVDLQLSDSWTDRCPGDAEPSSMLFTQAGDRDDPYGVSLVGKERMRLVLLDLGDDNVLGIVIDSSDPDRFDTLAAQAMPIIESFRIKE
jgi:hypothetical protein